MQSNRDLIARSYFTTEALDTNERFDAWEDSISVIFDVAPTEHTMARPFCGDIESYMIGTLMASHCKSKIQSFSRSNSTIARDGMDHILLQFYLKGGNLIHTEDDTLPTQAGDIQIIDMAQELKTEAHSAGTENSVAEFENISLVIARDRLEELIPHINSLHLTVIKAGTPLNLILRNYILNMYENAAQLTNAEADALVQPTIELLGATLGKNTQVTENSQDTLDTASLITVRKFIDRNIHLPRLGPDMIAEYLGISRASLYRMCTAFGGIAGLIKKRRMLLARRMLNGSSTSQSVKSISYSLGFSNPTSFARLYKQQFGYSPTDTRSMFLEAEEQRYYAKNPNLNVGDRKYEFWMTNLVM